MFLRVLKVFVKGLPVTVNANVQIPYQDIVQEIELLFEDELSPETISYLGDLIRKISPEKIGSAHHGVLASAVDRFLIRRSELLKDHKFRLPMLKAMFATQSSAYYRSYDEYLQLDFTSRFSRVRFDVAKLCLDNNHLVRQSISVLGQIIASEASNSCSISAKVALYTFEATRNILQEFIDDHRSGVNWNAENRKVFDKVIAQEKTITREGVNSLSHDDFCFLAKEIGASADILQKSLLQKLLVERQFESRSQKINCLIALQNREVHADAFLDFLENEDVALLEKETSDSAKDLLAYFINRSRYEIDFALAEEDVTMQLFDADIAQVPAMLEQISFEEPKERFSLILNRVKDPFLSDAHEHNALALPLQKLAKQVHQLGAEVVPLLVSNINSHQLDWVCPFLFQCLTLFESEELKGSFSKLADIFTERENARNAFAVLNLFEKIGEPVVPFLVERLKKSDSIFEKNHLLRALLVAFEK